jgi:hypothetical protein
MVAVLFQRQQRLLQARSFASSHRRSYTCGEMMEATDLLRLRIATCHIATR